jgi:hypothetical protein
MTTPELRDLLDRCTQHSPLPWHHAHGKIWAQSLSGGETPIADVRGWGYLTGGGSLKLDHDLAANVQDEAWGPLFALAPTLAAELIEARAEIERLRDMAKMATAEKEG